MAGNKETSIGVRLTADLRNYLTNLTKGQKAIRNFKHEVKSQTSQIPQYFKNIAGTIGLAFGLSTIVDFTKQLINLSGEAAGVERAFFRIADKNYLQELKESVKGTVSELELMKRAVQANNFDIPLTSLGNLLSFAAARAQATGQNVDELVNKIVLGIGRKSPLILDDLGISTTRLKDKMNGVSMAAASVGDVAKVVGDIASEELEKIGGIADTSATKIANITAEWQNFKVELSKSEGFQNYLSGSLKELEQVSTIAFTDQISGWKKFTTLLFGSKKTWEELSAEINKTKKNLGFIDEDSAEYRNNLNQTNTTLKKQTITYGDLKEQISEKTKLLELADITDKNYIRTLYNEIDALQAQKKQFEDLANPISKRTSAGTIMQSIQFDGKIDNNQVDTSQLKNMGNYLDANTKKARELQQALLDATAEENAERVGLLSSSFATMGGAIGGAAGSFLQMAAQVLNLVPQLITQITALTAAKGSEAISSGVAAAQSVPFPLNLIATAATVASIISALATKPPKLAAGGIAYGDTLARVGEYAGAGSNPEVIAPLNKLKSLLPDNKNQPETIIPSLYLRDDHIEIMFNRAQRRKNKRT